jgi:hypothetical protein
MIMPVVWTEANYTSGLRRSFPSLYFASREPNETRCIFRCKDVAGQRYVRCRTVVPLIPLGTI